MVVTEEFIETYWNHQMDTSRSLPSPLRPLSPLSPDNFGQCDRNITVLRFSASQPTSSHFHHHPSLATPTRAESASDAQPASKPHPGRMHERKLSVMSRCVHYEQIMPVSQYAVSFSVPSKFNVHQFPWWMTSGDSLHGFSMLWRCKSTRLKQLMAATAALISIPNLWEPTGRISVKTGTPKSSIRKSWADGRLIHTIEHYRL